MRNARSWEKGKYDYVLDETDEKEIARLLIGRSVVEADSELGYMVLDDGTRLRVVGNKGCGGCCSGWYEVKGIAEVRNAITSVDTDVRIVPDTYGEDKVYRIYVVADGIRTELLNVSGSDGNGYYGTGYEIYVTLPKEVV